VRLSGPVNEPVAREARRLTAALENLRTGDHDLRSRVRVLGPAPAGLARLQGRFRWQILIKSYGRAPLVHLLQYLDRTWTPPPRSHLTLTLDIDPSTLF
jgi:primosomal protein N' (replication factor Y) (superfamily II helicase)